MSTGSWALGLLYSHSRPQEISRRVRNFPTKGHIKGGFCLNQPHILMSQHISLTVNCRICKRKWYRLTRAALSYTGPPSIPFIKKENPK